MRVMVLADSDPTTTARYLENAILDSGDDLIRVAAGSKPPDHMKPDILLAIDPFISAWPQWLPKLECPTAIYLIDVHQNFRVRELASRFFDHVFVAQRDYVSKFAHPSVHWLPLAADPAVHTVHASERTLDVGFVGKLGPKAHPRRRVLESVLAQFATNELGRHYSPLEMGRVYGSSKIVFNKSIGGDLNMRFFEGMASGALLITDRIENGIDEVASDGVHYIGYESINEAIEQVRYYLQHSERRLEISALGQEHILQNHTYKRRWIEIRNTVRNGVGVLSPMRSAEGKTVNLWTSRILADAGATPPDVAPLVFSRDATPLTGAFAALACGRYVSRKMRSAFRSAATRLG